jgi:hypothetical protein
VQVEGVVELNGGDCRPHGGEGAGESTTDHGVRPGMLLRRAPRGEPACFSALAELSLWPCGVAVWGFNDFRGGETVAEGREVVGPWGTRPEWEGETKEQRR